MMVRFLTAALVAVVIVWVAYRSQALTVSGAVSAFGMGTLVLGCGGVFGGGVLLAFFISSTLLTRLGTRRKQAANVEYAKGGRRDWAQVWANGGVATALALAGCLGLLSRVSPEVRSWMFIGSLAAATADTWATEVGGLSPHPRLITTGQRVSPGVSGGVTFLGLLASMLGGMWIGGVGVLLMGMFPSTLWGHVASVGMGLKTVLGASVAGLVGSVWDSVLGSTVQAMYWCPTCQKETEQRVHRCGTRTQFVRGWSWMSNDVVNFTATCIGCIIAALLKLLG